MRVADRAAFHLFLLTILLTVSRAQSQKASKVVEIEPAAFNIMLEHYDHIFVLFFRGEDSGKQLIAYFEHAVESLSEDSEANNSLLFAICDLQKDSSGKLAHRPGIELVSNIKSHALSLSPQSAQHEQTFFKEVTDFFKKHQSPALQQHSIGSYQKKCAESAWTVAVFPNSRRQVEQSLVIYRRLFDYLQLFGVQMVAVYDSPDSLLEQTVGFPTLHILKHGQPYSEYPKSAVEALYSFEPQIANVSKQEIAQLVDFINVETIDEVSELVNDTAYYRVFGSQLDAQILLVMKQADKEDQEIRRVRETFRATAIHNKEQGMKFERVLFAEATAEFLEDYFADDLLGSEEKFKIVYTKTEYSSFQLKKYVFPGPVTQEALVQFLDDVRMRRLEPLYKSEPIPDPFRNEASRVKKIVGDTFISEIFGKANRSIMVLFIDSKDKQAYKQHMKKLKEFADKYHEAIEHELDIAVFDLAKNEHKLLTIREAPQLVLFEKTNKKKPSFFRGEWELDIIKNWVNYQVRDITIPDNFGEPLLPLGPSNTDL